ncbi:MAG: biotin--[acetyl-CoA-carboxylase] ligase [Planctomycetes bacterium]|nr:biotin--[acetyl-CoA-carboxylase] ligase [Planctomycetota bacterium]
MLYEPLFPSNEAARAFSAGLRSAAVGKRIDYRARAESTNALAAEAAREGAGHGLVVVAEEQSAGRGRQGRSWLAPPGQGLLFSVVLRPANLPQERFGWVALAAGLACAEAIEARTGVAATVKWPNDIVVAADAPTPNGAGWRKLGGVLCESAFPHGSSAGHLVVGIGLNILQEADALPAVPKSPPTSVRIESGMETDRAALFGAVLETLDTRFAQLSDGAGFASVREDLARRLDAWWRGRTLRLGTAGGAREGRFRGLDAFGRLRIENERGADEAFADAEVLGVFG